MLFAGVWERRSMRASVPKTWGRGPERRITMGVRVESAEYLDRWDVLASWSVEVLAEPATSPEDSDTMREAVRTGLLVMAQHLASHGVTVALSAG
jgi:hypothetical protein